MYRRTVPLVHRKTHNFLAPDRIDVCEIIVSGTKVGKLAVFSVFTWCDIRLAATDSAKTLSVITIRGRLSTRDRFVENLAQDQLEWNNLSCSNYSSQ